MKTEIKNTTGNGFKQGFVFLSFPIFLLFAAGCGGSKNSPEDLQNISSLNQLVETREFELENQWAMPLRGGMVNLIGNSNYIRFEKDSVDLFLPYFGVRHSGGSYGTGQGIEYEGLLKNLKVSEGDDGNVIIDFEGSQNTENLNFRITLYPNKTAHTSVQSTQRDAISYRGNVQALEEDEE